LAKVRNGESRGVIKLPESLSFWLTLMRVRNLSGPEGTDFDACFITRMRERALDADIVV